MKSVGSTGVAQAKEVGGHARASVMRAPKQSYRLGSRPGFDRSARNAAGRPSHRSGFAALLLLAGVWTAWVTRLSSKASDSAVDRGRRSRLPARVPCALSRPLSRAAALRPPAVRGRAARRFCRQVDVAVSSGGRGGGGESIRRPCDVGGEAEGEAMASSSCPSRQQVWSGTGLALG